MKRSPLIVGIFSLLSTVSGCGANADSLIKEQITITNELADAIEKKDQVKADELLKKLQETNKKLEELKLSDEEKKKVVERHKDELLKADNRLFTARANTNLKLAGDLARNFGKGSGGLEFPEAVAADFAQQPMIAQKAPRTAHQDFKEPEIFAKKEEGDFNPVPLAKWDVKPWESVYPIKITKIVFKNGYFTVTCQFTEDDVREKVKKGKLKADIVFFDSENIVTTHGTVTDFLTDVTDKKDQGFRFSVQIPSTPLVYRSVRVEVQSVEVPIKEEKPTTAPKK